MLLRRLFEGRRPVSDRFAPLRRIEMFLFNALPMPGLRLDLTDDSTIVARQRAEDGSFELRDIAGGDSRPVNSLAGLRAGPGRVLVRFAPDRLSREGKAVAATGGIAPMLRTKHGPRYPSRCRP